MGAPSLGVRDAEAEYSLILYYQRLVVDETTTRPKRLLKRVCAIVRFDISHP
jgi:hypothetical protein